MLLSGSSLRLQATAAPQQIEEYNSRTIKSSYCQRNQDITSKMHIGDCQRGQLSNVGVGQHRTMYK
eukprot:scaffold44841_cov307-Skeletonema_marinoi.AAC.1